MRVSDPAAAGGDVRITHVFDAPREVVFAAWTTPEQVARWWAPEGFETPPGRFPYRSEIVEFSEPELIVLRVEPIAEAGWSDAMANLERLFAAP
jgi:uncharacterized protein YndB with AHSA1/START domain